MSICKKAQLIRSKPQDARLIKRLFPKGKEENQSKEKPRIHSTRNNQVNVHLRIVVLLFTWAVKANKTYDGKS